MAGSISVGGKVIATHTGPKGSGTVDLDVNSFKIGGNTIASQIGSEVTLQNLTLNNVKSTYDVNFIKGRDGSSATNAAYSALEIKENVKNPKDGYYWLITHSDQVARQWWCDMHTDGGGWILVARTAQGTIGTGNLNWFEAVNAGSFSTSSSGTFRGGGYWTTFGANEVMWDVYLQNSQVQKVAFNYNGESLPTSSGYSNLPTRTFIEWCREVENAPGFNPNNYFIDAKNNSINGEAHFTEDFVITWSFRDTGGAADAGTSGPYWFIGNHNDTLHQHYEETSVGQTNTGSGIYHVSWNEDNSWGGGGSNQGFSRSTGTSSNGHVNIWIR